MAIASAGELAARLDRLPMTRHIWVLVTLISLGGAFEFYDLFLTAYIAPGLVKAGYFTRESLGPFSVLAPYGVAGVGTFVFAMFAGLFVGAIFLGHFADRYGRRTVFTFSLIWYSSRLRSWRSRLPALAWICGALLPGSALASSL